MSINSVKNTNFLNNKSIKIEDNDYVFIKPRHQRNNLYYVKYKKFKDKIKNYNHIDPNNVENQDNKIIFEIFTLDEDKYNKKCNSRTQNPFSIDEVAKNKGFYSVEKGKNLDITGTDNKIITNHSNVYVTFYKGIVNNVSNVNVIKRTATQIYNTLTNDNSPTIQPNKPLLTEDFITDTSLKKYLNDNRYTDEKTTIILRNFSTLDINTQNKVKQIVITNNEANNQRLNFNKQNLLNLLSSADTNRIQDKISESITKKRKGGKATRRRKRKGKKRSKNTRKKRKSKKQRRQ